MVSSEYFPLILFSLLLLSMTIVAGASGTEQLDDENTDVGLQSISTHIEDTTLQHGERTTLTITVRQSPAGRTVELTGDIQIPEGIVLINEDNPNQAFTQTAPINLTIPPGSMESKRYQIVLLRQEEKIYTFRTDFVLDGQAGGTNQLSGLTNSVEQIKPDPRLLPQLTTRGPATEVGGSLSQIRIFSTALLILVLPALLYEADRKIYPGPNQHIFGVLATGVTFATFIGQLTFVASYSVSAYVWPTLIIITTYIYINRFVSPIRNIQIKK